MAWLEQLEPVILVFHYIICIFIIVVILLQAGKGADMGATLGVGGSQTLFGARGAATLLSKITTIVAIMFLMTSVSLAAIHKQRSRDTLKDSVVNVDAEPSTPTEPVAPVPSVMEPSAMEPTPMEVAPAEPVAPEPVPME